MRENRKSGSEGGGRNQSVLPTPTVWLRPQAASFRLHLVSNAV